MAMKIKIIDEKDLPSPNEEELKFAENIKDSQIDTSDIPELTSSQLKEIAALARKKRETMPTVSLRIPESVLNRYKVLGKGYTTVMSDILTSAAAYF